MARCTDSSVRLTTMVMEYTAKELLAGGPFLEGDKKGEEKIAKIFTPKEQEIRNECLSKYGMKQALQEYEVVPIQKEDGVKNLLSGDLVLWRWNSSANSRAGHVVMFIETAKEDGNEFWGIEANRLDDNTLEGIYESRVPLWRENRDVYVLRRRIIMPLKREEE